MNAESSPHSLILSAASAAWCFIASKYFVMAGWDTFDILLTEAVKFVGIISGSAATFGVYMKYEKRIKAIIEKICNFFNSN